MPTIEGEASLSGAGDVTSPAATLELLSTGASLAGTVDTLFTRIPESRRRRVVICGTNGVVLGELENAVLGSITYTLNQPEEWSFTLLQNDPKTALVLNQEFHECQVYRGDQILAWGPMVRPAMDKRYLAVGCRGALWHLTRRYIGKANRTNYVNNGSFEDGLAGWTMRTNEVANFYDWPGAQATPPINSVVDYPTVIGKYALRLENYVEGADASAQQQFTWTVDVDTSPNGDVWTLRGYAFVESYTAAATEGGRGLYIERFSTTQLNPDPYVQAVLPGSLLSIQHQFVSMDEDTALNRWERHEIGLEIPPKAGEPEIVDIRLYAPVGVVYWDAVGLTLIERLAFYSKDQTSVIAKGIVEHLQDPAYGKTDINIATNTPPSGVLRTREYVHSEHPNGFGALEEFTTLDNGFDFDITYTPTVRTFNTYYPRKGNYKAACLLELGVTDGYTNIAEFTWSFDGEAAANSIVVLGTGDGSDREEGSAVEGSAYSNGQVLEEVFVSPPETTIDALDNMAAERLAASLLPQSLEIQTTPPQPGHFDLVGQIWPGDTVPVLISHNNFSASGIWRVVRVVINPDDTLDITLNKRAEDQV